MLVYDFRARTWGVVPKRGSLRLARFDAAAAAGAGCIWLIGEYTRERLTSQVAPTANVKKMCPRI
jgi:hypothetical protein